MNRKISDLLFRSLGTHALKALSVSESELTLIVAPWDNLENEAVATFENVKIIYIEGDSGEMGVTSYLNLPWDIIRFDSTEKADSIWEFGLCCDEVKLGFRAPMPKISFG
ncbi:hypothetical protein TW85_23000 [Marinomonas sp. S3726]|uniref:hypothetical protein n=1 Tax=Marinomonas sp. S3726 TaxID=579484 RepID=UPI0005FA335F|nr:hypothetical protein [Marinomonas sp. S3726]KJZ08906.1 hypothetical protein TW85_23000 [Marinomonas sp. S3726]